MSKHMYLELFRTTGAFNAARIARIMGVSFAQVQLWMREANK